ncbi:MAG: hypothetical protein ACRCYQ_07050 [Nocardioides sp.]
MIRFDPPALHVALDAERRRRGLTWAAVAAETLVATTTINRLTRDGGPAGARFEVDGILALTHWLGRTIEDFTRETPH